LRAVDPIVEIDAAARMKGQTLKAYFAKLDSHKIITMLLYIGMVICAVAMFLLQIMKPDQTMASDISVGMVALVALAMAVGEFLDDIETHKGH
jgi:ABC-type nickel/cobalt efflux system permease component RcnA